MEIKRKNLYVMIPGEVHTRVHEGQEQVGLKLNEYIEMIVEKHFEEGEKIMVNGTRILAFQVSKEPFARIKGHLRPTGQSQKGFITGLIEQALTQKVDQTEPVGNEQPDEVGAEGG